MICDNASNNDTMVTELESLGGMNSAQTRVRCFCHILNLVVKVRTAHCDITVICKTFTLYSAGHTVGLHEENDGC